MLANNNTCINHQSYFWWYYSSKVQYNTFYMYTHLFNITILNCLFQMIFYVAPLILTCVLYGLIARILFNSTVIFHSSRENSQQNSAAQKKNPISSSRVQVRYRIWVIWDRWGWIGSNVYARLFKTAIMGVTCTELNYIRKIY